MRSEGITIFMEPKALYNDPKAEAPVPADYEVPFGKAKIQRKGKDLTIVTWGNTTLMSLEAAEKIKAETGKEVEVLDLRSLTPLDEEAILSSVKKTGKVLIAHEDKIFGSFGGEIAALISQKAFEDLDGPVQRIGAANTPVGFNRILEKAILPDTEKIYNAALNLLNY
jgi:2-oxoisovalerate dehydrogenase E1 component